MPMRSRLLPPHPTSPRPLKRASRFWVPLRGDKRMLRLFHATGTCALARSLIPGNSGGIVRGSGMFGNRRRGRARFRLRLAALEIFPQRRREAPLAPFLLCALGAIAHAGKLTAARHHAEAPRRDWPGRARACAICALVASIAAFAAA